MHAHTHLHTHVYTNNLPGNSLKTSTMQKKDKKIMHAKYRCHFSESAQVVPVIQVSVSSFIDYCHCMCPSGWLTQTTNEKIAQRNYVSPEIVLHMSASEGSTSKKTIIDLIIEPVVYAGSKCCLS